MLYPVAIERGNSTTAFGVVVPDIAGCYSAGDSFEDALINAKEAIEIHLEILCDEEKEIPVAASIDHHFNSECFTGWVWAIVEVDVTPYLGKSQKINVTLPENLIKRIDDKVATEKTYKSRSSFLAQAALHELEPTKYA